MTRSAGRSCHRKEQHLWHRNMPNVRIGTIISRRGHDPRAESSARKPKETLRWPRILHRLYRLPLPNHHLNPNGSRRQHSALWLRRKPAAPRPRSTPGRRPGNPAARKAPSRRATATGRTKASPRISRERLRRHSGARKARTRNLEIPRCAIAHLRSTRRCVSRNDGAFAPTKKPGSCAASFILDRRKEKGPAV